jgi:hypothetical protein
MENALATPWHWKKIKKSPRLDDGPRKIDSSGELRRQISPAMLRRKSARSNRISG